MSGFQVGDVVVCVDASPYRLQRYVHLVWPIARNRCLKVEAVLTAPCGNTGLHFFDGPLSPSPWGFDVTRFRKIRPASDEFIASLRACKPQRVGEPA
jgi:hypothetical protein